MVYQQKEVEKQIGSSQPFEESSTMDRPPRKLIKAWWNNTILLSTLIESKRISPVVEKDDGIFVGSSFLTAYSIS